VGLQLTHSGRYARPVDAPHAAHRLRAPRSSTAGGRRCEQRLLADDELDDLAEPYVAAAVLAQQAGFAFVDVKHCHGYLLHELLSAREPARPLRRGRSPAHPVPAHRRPTASARAPGLAVGVRLSAFDLVPYRAGRGGVGEPEDITGPYPFGFGGDETGTGIDLTESTRCSTVFEELGIGLVCVTAGSPYYNPHIQRPAYFPPSDGYQPPEDPLVDVARQIAVTAELAHEHPALAMVGGGYSYLQEWLPHVGPGRGRRGGAAVIGLGRMALSYPELPADVLAGRPLESRLLCRTFSDCTTAPRAGLVSGCFPPSTPSTRSSPVAASPTSVEASVVGDPSGAGPPPAPSPEGVVGLPDPPSRSAVVWPAGGSVGSVVAVSPPVPQPPTRLKRHEEAEGEATPVTPGAGTGLIGGGRTVDHGAIVDPGAPDHQDRKSRARRGVALPGRPRRGWG
jgi:2,4-dienoyl-CoA reductase-like NADH-dependent reductase (Old Yellow Enzyme family)